VAWAEAYLHTKWHLDPSSRVATTDMGQKLEDCDFWGGRAGSPSNTYVAFAETYPHTKFHLDL